jgi:two-component system, OmpR family, phosphate regulon response regulator PhoB
MPLAMREAMPTVLVVDDEPPIVELVRFTLEDDTLRVLEAGDGVTALEIARRERPELILLDVQMPRLGGLEVCRRVRRDPLLSGTRIVMLTAADQEADRARGLAAGADEYLAKPFSPLALFALVRTLLPGVSSWPET